MPRLYQHLTKSHAFARDIQEVFWKDIFPVLTSQKKDEASANPNKHSLLEVFNRTKVVRSVENLYNSPELEFFNRIQEKYPFLSMHMFIFELPAGFATPIHVDEGPEERERINGKRVFSINVPIKGCGKLCTTEFFEVDPKDLLFVRSANTIVPRPGAPIKLFDQYVLEDCPIIIDTQIPHRVNNIKGIESRLSVSWTIKDSWSWDAVVNYLETK